MRRFFGTRTTRLGVSLAAAGLLLASSAGVTFAHTQTVTPPAHDGPVVTGPISKSWAQAHCNAQSPAVVADASGGVVVFSPQAALPCPPVENPGGHVHPGAD